MAPIHQEQALASGFERFAEVLDCRLGELRTELRAEIAGAEARLRADMAAMEARIQREMRLQLFWFASMQTAIIVAVAALFKLFI